MSGLVGMVNKDLVVSYTIVVSFSHGIGLAAVIWGPLPLFPAFLLSCVVHFIMAVGFPNNIPTIHPYIHLPLSLSSSISIGIFHIPLCCGDCPLCTCSNEVNIPD